MKILKALPLTILAVGLYSCEPNEPVDPLFLEDTEVIVIKTPSIVGDKKIIE